MIDDEEIVALRAKHDPVKRPDVHRLLDELDNLRVQIVAAHERIEKVEDACAMMGAALFEAAKCLWSAATSDVSVVRLKEAGDDAHRASFRGIGEASKRERDGRNGAKR